jgi:hypothetical protein
VEGRATAAARWAQWYSQSLRLKSKTAPPAAIMRPGRFGAEGGRGWEGGGGRGGGGGVEARPRCPPVEVAGVRCPVSGVSRASRARLLLSLSPRPCRLRGT